jgi:hypothetical protein
VLHDYIIRPVIISVHFCAVPDRGAVPGLSRSGGSFARQRVISLTGLHVRWRLQDTRFAENHASDGAGVTDPLWEIEDLVQRLEAPK